MFLHLVTTIGSRNFTNHMFGLEKNRALVGFRFTAKGTKAERDAEEPGKAQGLIAPDGLQMAPKPF